MPMIDKSYRQSLHTVVKDYIPQEVIDKGNKEKSWFWGYHKSYDIVVISHDGTLGEIVRINGLVIGLPLQPNKIRKDDLQEEHQKWSRHKVPQDLSMFDKLYKDESNIEGKLREVHLKNIDFIRSDFKRIKEGDRLS